MPKSWLVRGAETAERNRRNMLRTGFTPNGHPLWEQWEVQPVVDRYPDYNSIFPMLARRTKGATYGKAGRLGVTKHRAPAWSENEIIRLRKVYPTGTRAEIEAAFPGRTYRAVGCAARKRGIYRVKRPYPISGITMLDQIMDRAQQLKLTPLDLDHMGRRGPYFSKRKWRIKPNHGLHCSLVRQLGGRVRATFGGRP